MKLTKSLKKLNSANAVDVNGSKQWDYDTNNSYGIPETMSAEECAKMLYAQGVNFTKYEEMIAFIEKIGNTVRGFEAFGRVASDLRTDIDLALELFSVFARTRVSKITVIRNNVAGTAQNTVQESNTDSNKDNAMLYDLRNNSKFSIINLDHDIYTEPLNKYEHRSDDSDALGTLLENYKKAKTQKDKRACEKELDRIIKEISDITRAYFGSVSETAIQNYIEQGNSANGHFKNKVKNLQKLVKELVEINKQAKTSKAAYKALENEANKVRTRNKHLRMANVLASEDDFESVALS